VDGRRAIILPVAVGLVGLVVGWFATHGVLAVAGYDGDPSRGAAFTGAAILGVASAGIASWLVARGSRTD
jgi:hypothetical protein